MESLFDNVVDDSSAKNLNVLYVDDEKEVVEEVEQILQIVFKNVYIAYNGEEALKLYKENEDIDLVITDIVMPVKNGIELIHDIRIYDKKIPIVVISAISDFNYLLDAIALNVDGYLIKPVKYRQLMEVLQNSFERILLQKENEAYKKSLEEKVESITLKLQQKYYQDDLTGLKNRNALLQDIAELNPEKISIVDINNFSAINDSYGYDIGDTVLRKVSHKLKKSFEDKCNIYRISSDQLAFLPYSKNDYINCNLFVENVHSTINNEFVNIKSGELEVEISISVTIGIAKDVPSNKLLESADLALHYAKKTKQHSAIFRDEIIRLINHKKKFNAITLVKQALENQRIVPYFQPIRKKTDSYFESLVRIIDENDSVVSPMMFLEEIKHTLYYSELTKTMIRKSFEHFSDIDSSFSINLSFEDISNVHIITYLKEQVKLYNVMDKLIIEILEGESIDNFNQVKDFINEMKNLGVRIAIDDFGSGYSNFSYLLEFEPDYIKIDGSIIQKIAIDPKSLSVVKAIVDFAQAIDVKVIAEYVCDSSISDILETLNIDGMQGYYIGKPAPLASVKDFLVNK